MKLNFDVSQRGAACSGSSAIAAPQNTMLPDVRSDCPPRRLWRISELLLLQTHKRTTQKPRLGSMHASVRALSVFLSHTPYCWLQCRRCSPVLDGLRKNRLVQQRTACLDAVRMAYVRDVISVKTFLLQHQVRDGIDINRRLVSVVRAQNYVVTRCCGENSRVCVDPIVKRPSQRAYREYPVCIPPPTRKKTVPAGQSPGYHTPALFHRPPSRNGVKGGRERLDQPNVQPPRG